MIYIKFHLLALLLSLEVEFASVIALPSLSREYFQLALDRAIGLEEGVCEGRLAPLAHFGSEL